MIVENDFIKKINDVYEKCFGNETYGNTTEFYDEDGVVLMTITEENNKLIFMFTEDSDVFEYEETGKQENFDD